MTTRRLGLWLCVTALALGTPGLAFAQELDDQTRSAARELATEGSSLYEQNDFDGAYDRFNRAFQLVQRPNVGIWAARSLVRAGRWVEASERYLELERFALPADAPAEQGQAVQDAARERRELLGRMPSIKVVVEGAEPSSVFVSLNGQLVKPALIGAKQPVNPGKLLVKGVRGERVVEQAVELGEAQFREVRLVFRPSGEPAAAQPAGPALPSAPPASPEPAAAAQSPLRLYGFIGLGVGGAALLTGAVFGGLALSDKSELEAGCSGGRCPPEFHSQNDSYETKKVVTSIGLIGGTVLAATGAVLIFAAPTSRDRASRGGVQLRAYLAPSGAGVSGAF